MPAQQRELQVRPRFPDTARFGIGIIGCGGIAQTAHLPAYLAHGLDIISVWSRSPETAATVRDRFPNVQSVAESPAQILADPRVDIVDIATPVENRLDLAAAAVRAGKHILAQKPLTTDLDKLPALLDEAHERGVRIAVNQNGRWAPAWRRASLLVNTGAVGNVVGVTHLHDKPLPPIAGTPFDRIPHMLITDYLVHWIDITRCWLRGKQVAGVQARDARVPGQPAHALNPWAAILCIYCTDGTTAILRIVGDAHATKPGCPFWIHGTDGTIRGSILGGSDVVELDRGSTSTRFTLDGQWFVDGFAGTMGELMCAIDEDREPENSARDNIATLRLVLAARQSAELGGPECATDDLRL